MGGIAQQRHAAVGPLADRLAVGRGPAFPAPGQFDELARLGTDALEIALHLFLGTLGHAPFFGLAAVEGHDHVVLLAPAQRVVHQVTVGADPDAGRVPLQVLGKVLLVHHRAVDHVAGDAGRVAHVLLAHHRLHPVGADQGHAPVRVAVLVVDRDAVGVLLHTLDAGGGQELDAPGLLRALQQREVHVHPVDHGIGVAETLAKGLTGGNPAHLVFVDGVVHHHVVGVDGASTGLLAHAQGVEGVEGVGAQLDAGADLTDLGRLLQHLDPETLAHQRQRSGESTDAPTGDQHRQPCPFLVHLTLLVQNGCISIVSTHTISIVIR